MRLSLKLFGPFLQWFYHGFDRIVINGYLSFLTRENNAVYFFHDVRGEPVLTKELLRQRTDDYQCWVENYAAKNHIPILWAEVGVRKKDWLAPSCQAQQKAGRFGVCFILRRMEQGPTFAIRHPKFPTPDPNYRTPEYCAQTFKNHARREAAAPVGAAALGVSGGGAVSIHLVPHCHQWRRHELRV